MVVRACLGAGGLSMFGGGCLRLKYSPVIKSLWGSSTFHLCFKMSALQCVGCQMWNRNCKRGYMHVFSVPGRFLLNWQRSAPLWSAGLTVHILYTHQTGGSLCTCQRGGLGLKTRAKPVESLSSILSALSSVLSDPTVFLTGGFPPSQLTQIQRALTLTQTLQRSVGRASRRPFKYLWD